MSQIAQGELTSGAKTFMLNAFRMSTRNLIIVAQNAANANRSDEVPVAFTGATSVGGVTEINLDGSVSLVIQSGSEGANAVAKIRLINNSNPDITVGQTIFTFDVSTSQGIFTIVDENGNPAPIEFPDGGSLVVNTLKVKLTDPT